MESFRDIRIGFVGCVAEGRRSLETLLDMSENVVAAFTLRPELAAKVSGAVRWDDLTAAHSIPLHYVSNMNEPDAIALLRAARPDLVLCVGWTQLLKPPILEIPSLGCLGFHASLLPRYRGRAPINWAIIHGEVETGNTLMVLDEGVDTGDIVAQRRFPIEAFDTCATLYEKVARSEDLMIREVMPLIRAGRMPRTPQNHAEGTVMPRRRPEDGRINWSATTRKCHDWVRALTHPYPGAFTTLSARRVFLWKASPWRPGPGGTVDPTPQPGWWRVAQDPPMLLAGTGDGTLTIERVQAEGEDEIDGLEFARRLPDEGLIAEGTT